jgi:hypothetical protein
VFRSVATRSRASWNPVPRGLGVIPNEKGRVLESGER